MSEAFQLKEPCMCGDTACRSCGPAQGYYGEPGEDDVLTADLELVGGFIDDAADFRDPKEKLVRAAWTRIVAWVGT